MSNTFPATSHPDETPKSTRLAIFDCPKEITEEQKQEIRSFAEHVEKQQKDPEK